MTKHNLLSESGALIIPSMLGLNQVNISHMGDLVELSTVCRKVTELDLSHNIISSWQQVKQYMLLTLHGQSESNQNSIISMFCSQLNKESLVLLHSIW
jgi:hypothetical protein